MYMEGIIERLHPNSNLRQKTNPARNVLINSVGALLDSWDLEDFLESPFLQNASKNYLDLHGKDLNVPRKIDEDDSDYRNRIIYEVLGYLTADYLINVYGLTLFSYVDDFNVHTNTLTSDNQYLKPNGLMTIADDEIKSILNRKFVLDEGLSWLSV